MNNKLFSGVMILLLASVTGFGENAVALEKPQYTVEFSSNGFEIRNYQPYLVAETLVEATVDYDEAANEGFRRLFRYIDGDNDSRQGIAMTAPVQQVQSGSKIAMTAPVQQTGSETGWLISFMVPAKYTLSTVPQPDDERIVIRQVPSQLVAAQRYAGRWSAANFSKHEQRLLEKLQALGVTPAGPATSAVYNPPFMPPFLRRNEVLIAVEEFPATATSE
jgi:hypothetical protein